MMAYSIYTHVSIYDTGYFIYPWSAIPTAVVSISIGILMFLVGIVTFIAGVVMLVRAKRVLHHSSQPPSHGTDHYDMVDEGVKSAALGAGVYEEVDKQDTQTDGHPQHYISGTRPGKDEGERVCFH